MSLGRSFEDRPQLEAQFFRNFSCCGLDLQDLHGLLEHFEECHVAFEEGDASESGMDVDMEMEDNVSEGTISGPPSPRIPAGQPPRSIYEMKKSSLRSNGLHSSLDPLAPGTSNSNQHLDGGMELDMDMDDTPASIYSSNSQHTISISTTLASNSNSGSASGSTTASNSDTSPSSGAYPPPMSAFHSPLTLAGGSNKKKFSTAMNAHQIGGIMRGSGMGGMMGLEALAAARAASAYSTPDSSVPGTPVMEEVPGGGVNGLFSVGRIEDAGGTASSTQSALGGSTHNMNMGNNGLAPSLFLPASASPSSSTATAEAPDSPPSDSGSNHEGSNSGTESKESTPIFKTLALAPIPNDSRSSYPLLQHSRAATNHAAGSTIVTLSASRSSTAAANAALNAANNAHHHNPSSSRTSHSTATSGGAVEKPFRCAVVGCDKSYKQQNGLKYHRLHGHCTTASLGKIGTESRKAGKPYVCHVSSCGKRYKK
jgi:transcription factor SFP1